VKILAISHLERDLLASICNCSLSRERFILENGKKLGALMLSGLFQRYAKPELNQKK